LREIVIITNNPAVVDDYPEASCHIQGSVQKVFTTVRDAVHKGARIITHPLCGSIKPNESPYKSVVITTATGKKAACDCQSDFLRQSQTPVKLDMKSLSIIEDAIATLARLPHRNRKYDESVLEDFRIIDLNFIRVANMTS